MWDLPGPGLKPVSPALAGRFLATVPPGKPRRSFIVTLPRGINSQKGLIGTILPIVCHGNNGVKRRRSKRNKGCAKDEHFFSRILMGLLLFNRWSLLLHLLSLGWPYDLLSLGWPYDLLWGVWGFEQTGKQLPRPCGILITLEFGDLLL